jgi:hypothetical protein
VQPYDEDEQFFYQVLQVMEHQWNEIDRGKPTTLCPPQISHGLDPGSNPGLRGERPATNRLSHGTATLYTYFLIAFIVEQQKN